MATSSPTFSDSPTTIPSSAPTVDCANYDLQSAFVVETNDDSITDVDGSGTLTPGDVYVFDNVARVNGTDIAGQIYGRCTVLEDVGVLEYCALHMTFPSGTVYAQGPFIDMTIVEGTDCYFGYAGSILADAINETEFGYTFEVVLDEEPLSPDCPSAFSEMSQWIETAGDTFVDPDSDGLFSAGDFLVFDNNTITVGANTTGIVTGECVILPTTDFEYCLITYEFEEGSLTVQGVFFSGMVVIGGTGCFRGKQGFVVGSTFDESSFAHDVTFADSPPPLNCIGGLFGLTWREAGNKTLSDYDLNGILSEGEKFVWDSHTLEVGNGILEGTASGRCSLLPGFEDDDEVYCLISFEFDDLGTLVLQGIYSEMNIVGGSGCFLDVKGRVNAEQVGDTSFEYTFEIY